MEHRETEEMHEAVDQILRSALIAVGSLQQRLARRQQVAADQARMAASASRTETDAYTAAQDTMLRQSLRKATDPMWFDTSTPAERVATRDMVDRFSEVNPYAKTVLEHIDTEAARRGEVLTPPETGSPEPTPSPSKPDLETPDLGTPEPVGAERPEPVGVETQAETWTPPSRPTTNPGPTHTRADAGDTPGTEPETPADWDRSWAAQAAETRMPSPPTTDPGPTHARAASADTAATPSSSPTTDPGTTRRRPVAVDTTATEQEVADRLAASRSFPRSIFDRLRGSSGATLRPGSPTTLPRGRDKGLGL